MGWSYAFPLTPRGAILAGMRTPRGTDDLVAALAEELGRIGRRLDDMGTELLVLRSPGPAGPAEPGPEPEAAPWSQQIDVRAGEGVASDLDPVSDGVADAAAAQVPAAAAQVPAAAAAAAAAQVRGLAKAGVEAHVAQPAAAVTLTTPQAGAAPPVPPTGARPGPPYPPAAYPPGPYPPGSYPPGPYPNAYPPGSYPPGAYPGYGQAGSPPWGPPAPAPAAPAPERRRRASSAMSGARLLAWVGGAVTLLGVVMLLVLAASRGWFSIETRLISGAVLGAVLVGVGAWLHRRETARAGALALAATGFATLDLVTAAAAAFYDYLPPAPALLIALLVAGAGLAVADRWRSQLLGAAVTGAAALLAPAVTQDRLLVALVLALQLAAVAVVLRRRWPVLMLVAAAGPILYGSIVAADYADGGAGDRATAIGLALAVLVVAVGMAVPAARLLPVAPVGVLVGAASLPTLAVGVELAGWGGAAIIAGGGLVLAGFAALPGLDRRLRTVAVTAAVLDLFFATSTAFDGRGDTLTLVVLAEAIVATVLAAVLARPDSAGRFALVVGMVFGGLAVVSALADAAPLAALVRFPAFPYVVDGIADPGRLVTAVSVSALVLVFAGALLVAGGKVGWIRPDASAAALWVPIGLVGLYGATGLVVELALLVAPDRAGFTAGHALVTVSWAVGALVLLARGISRAPLRVAGLVLVAAAVTKLVLFDLVALDGLARVGAFLGAGLVLLAAGTRYTRLVAEAERDRDAVPPPE